MTLKIGIILGSTRPGRNGVAVGQWILQQAKEHGGADFEIVDLASFQLPILDEPHPAMMQKYTQQHTKKWSEKIASLDGYIFVTPEYNHSIPGALKNALDYLMVEWGNKVAGFVGYGSLGGARAVEHLRLIMSELRVATVRTQVGLSVFTDFENFTTFKPSPAHKANVQAMLDEVILWGNAFAHMRHKLPEPALH